MRASQAYAIAALAFLAALALSAFAPIAPYDSVADSQDADALITQNGSTVVVSYKNYAVRSAEYSAGSDIAVFDFGSVEGKLSIVLDGANIGDLSLFYVDKPDDFYRTLSVDFVMKSGSVRTLSLISVSPESSSALDTSYDRLFTVFRNVTVSLASGNITEICPTTDLLSVSAISYNLGNELSVDRFYPTGVNGKYGSVYVVLAGATVGYMTNISSRVGAIEYDIKTGSVSYLCIGANTEHSQSEYLANKSTFIATGDVTAHIGPLADVYTAILGAGILNIPSIICNGEKYTDLLVHNVTLDAEGTDISLDALFFNDNRNAAFALSSYVIGHSPSTAPIKEKCLYNRSSIDVYGSAGIWSSPSSATVSSGVSVFLNSDFLIKPEAVLTVLDGGYLSNSGFIELSGSLYNYGRFDSNGVIQCDSDSLLFGPIGGKSIVANVIYYSDKSESPRVMVSGSAASIVLSQAHEVTSVGAMLDGGYKSVIVEAKDSGTFCSDRFVLSVSPIAPPTIFEHAYRLDIFGIGYEDLSQSVITVTLNTDNSKCTSVYVRNGEFYEVIGTSEYASTVSFVAGNETVFYTLTHESEDPPIPVFPTHFKVLDYILCALVVALGVTILYVLYRMRRKNDA